MTFITLLKKEFLELYRTKKFLILPILIMIFSASSPIIAKMTPQIFESLMVDGIQIIFPEPTMKDAFLQLINNLNQMVLFILIFISTSIFISDKIKGRLLLLISKPINRTEIILSQLMNVTLQLFVSILIGSLFFIIYTQTLFKEFDYELYFQVMMLYILYGLFLISLTLFASTISKSYLISITISVVTFFTFGIFTLIKYDWAYLIPGKVTTLQEQLINGIAKTEHIVITSLSTLVLTLLFTIASIILFKHQEIE